MNYRVDHIPKTTQNNRRPGHKMTPEYITIHSTANPDSTAQNERDWLTNPQNTRTASWHIVVDDKQAVEAIPLDEVAWHAGDGGQGTGNRKTIGIEICESGNRTKTIENAVKLVAKLLHERNWGTDRLRRHYDWSKKNCPRIMSSNNWSGWNSFKLQVQRELDRLKKEEELDTIKINLRGRNMEVKGILKDQTYYVPVRFLENAGLKIDWDNKNKVVIIK